MMGGKRRRRMDTGLQKALGELVVSKRLACTTNAFIKANPGLYSEKHGLRFNEKLVSSTMSANWLTFSKCTHLSLSFDPSRHAFS